MYRHFSRLNHGRHTARIDTLRAITETWSAATIQSKGKELSDDLKLVILTASGALPLTRRHYLIPPEECSWEIWLEVTLCSEIVYRNSAFRYVDNPQGCPQLTLLLHDGSVKTTGGSRMTPHGSLHQRSSARTKSAATSKGPTHTTPKCGNQH